MGIVLWEGHLTYTKTMASVPSTTEAPMLETPVHDCKECSLGVAGRCPFVSKKLKAGQTLWMQGDVPREVVFVKDGMLTLSSTEPSGTETLSAVRGARSLVGPEALQGR